jgi:hypothetical protein
MISNEECPLTRNLNRMRLQMALLKAAVRLRGYCCLNYQTFFVNY